MNSSSDEDAPVVGNQKRPYEHESSDSQEDEMDMAETPHDSQQRDAPADEEDVFGAVPPICLSFNNLSYTVRLKKGPFSDGIRGLGPKLKSCKLWATSAKEILKPMSGHFLPGRLVAIMGPSGAGKTSLLNLLSGRTRSGRVDGEILVNGHKLNRDQFKRASAYVMQEDTLLGNLTPRELITYSALLRLPRNMPKHEKLERVEQVLRRLNLTRCADTRVGTTGVTRGISGGERRRVSIGLDLIVNPRLLFLDEPTSGLDSTMAEQVVTILRDLARQGRTVICTIHQPSSETFGLFDDVFWLANGSLVYSGPVASLPSYFREQGHPCPRFSNPADYYMRLFSRREGLEEEEYVRRIEAFADYHAQNSPIVPVEGYKLPAAGRHQRKSAASEPRRKRIAAQDDPDHADDDDDDKDNRDDDDGDGGEADDDNRRKKKKKKEVDEDADVEMEEFRNEKLPRLKKAGPYFWKQYFLLFARSWKSYLRDPGVTIQRLMITINIGIVVGLLFLQLGHYQTDIQNRQGVLFLLITQAVFMTGNSVLYLFPTERPTFLREYGNGMYSVGAYYLAKSTADMPFHIIFPIIGTTIIYWMVGLRADAGAFFICVGVMLLISNIAQSLGFLVSVGTELPVALTIFPVTVIPFMLVGGLFLLVSDIPKYFIWLMYISPFFYGFVTLVRNEMVDVTFKCRQSELVEGVCPVINGNEQIDRLEFDRYPTWMGPICLAAIYVILRVLTFLALLLLARKRSAT